MTPDDHSVLQSDEDAIALSGKFDLDTDEGLEAYLGDLETRCPVPESLRYPETDEEYDLMIAEVKADMKARGAIPFEKVKAWIQSWGSADELPRPEPECG